MAVATNVPVLGEEAEKQCPNFRLSTKLTKKTNFKLITEPAFLPNTCYGRLWVIKTKSNYENRFKRSIAES